MLEDFFILCNFEQTMKNLAALPGRAGGQAKNYKVQNSK